MFGFKSEEKNEERLNIIQVTVLLRVYLDAYITSTSYTTLI
jgi:hypothetical protein